MEIINLDAYASKINKYLTSFVQCTSSDQRIVEENDEDQNSVSKRSPKDLKSEKTTLPNDKNQFQVRLRTFQNIFWTTSIPPSLCSKYGWFLKERDLLQCVTCSAVVCSSLPPPNKKESYKRFSECLKERLRSGHKSWCGWPNNACSAEFLHPPLSLSVAFFSRLTNEASQIALTCLGLPFVNVVEILGKLGLDQIHLNAIYNGKESLSKAEVKAAVLVLCGWQFEKEQKIKCNLCLRSIGFWSFLSSEKESEFLELSRVDAEKKELKKKKEEKKRRKEKRKTVKDREERRKEKAEVEARIEKERAEAHTRKVEEAIKKLSEFRSESVFQDSEEVEDDVEDEQETSLLAEEIFNFDKLGHKYNRSKQKLLESTEEKSTIVEGDKAESTIEGDKTEESNLETAKEDKPDLESSKDKSIDQDLSMDESEIKESDDESGQSVSSEVEDDDLWLEAVGSRPVKVQSSREESMDSENSPSETDVHRDSDDSLRYSDDSFEPENQQESETTLENPLETDVPVDKKRRRDSENSSEEENQRESEVTFENPSKYLKLDEEIANFVVDNPSQPVSEQVEESSDSEVEVEEESDDKIFIEMKAKELDPLRQHRHWCGWITACDNFYLDDDTPGESRPGYKIVADDLKNNLPNQTPGESLASSEKYASTLEGLRAVRGILDGWTFPSMQEES